jgi:predicted GIY-YIG superfamily endonuclease
MALRGHGYLYVLRCSDGSFYTGSTNNLDARMAQHGAGEASAYTAKRLPVELIYTCEFDSLREAFYAERQLKGWSRAKKEALIRGDYDALVELSSNRQPNTNQQPPKHRHPEPVEGRDPMGEPQ